MSINLKNTGRAISSLSRINYSLCKNIFLNINNLKRHIRCHQDFLALREKEENLSNALALKNTLDEQRYAWKSIPLNLLDKLKIV